MTATNTVFATYMPRLMSDLGLSDFQAAAILGNAAYESSGFQDLVEGPDSPVLRLGGGASQAIDLAHGLDVTVDALA